MPKSRTLTVSDFKLPLALVALSVVPTLGGVMRFMSMSGNAPATEENARFVAAPAP